MEESTGRVRLWGVFESTGSFFLGIIQVVTHFRTHKQMNKITHITNGDIKSDQIALLLQGLQKLLAPNSNTNASNKGHGGKGKGRKQKDDVERKPRHKNKRYASKKSEYSAKQTERGRSRPKSKTIEFTGLKPINLNRDKSTDTTVSYKSITSTTMGEESFSEKWKMSGTKITLPHNRPVMECSTRETLVSSAPLFKC